VIIICLLAKTPIHEMHPAKYVFGSDGLVNQTGGWNDGLAFLFGLLSVQWTVRARSGLSSAGMLITGDHADDRL
jgi:hypothetical protein